MEVITSCAIGWTGVGNMTEHELKVLKRIPKKYREHIVSLTIEKSGDYNERGQELNNYIILYDNDLEVTFQNQNYMIWHLKEYTNDGYDRD